MIRRRYLRTWFLVDFASTFPFDHVSSLLIGEGGPHRTPVPAPQARPAVQGVADPHASGGRLSHPPERDEALQAHAEGRFLHPLLLLLLVLDGTHVPRGRGR